MPSHPALGSFVELLAEPHSRWGAGKLIDISGNVARIQYFDAPGLPLPKAVECPVNGLRRSKLPPQTRVWRRQAAGRWEVGRLLDDEGATLFVQFPNAAHATIEAADAFVRWNKPLADPLPLLCVEATESPYLADPRSEFVRAVTQQRWATSGVTALISASIELENYQFDVIRRVLSDPVQRYLLADEVGLGKTIEAGVVIRQHFLDDDAARAVVVVPPSLVSQWRTELCSRFGLDAWLDDFLHVVRHDDLGTLERVIKGAGLLVVDEAHHLSRWRNDAEKRLFDILCTHSQRVPKLLLLSATPVLADEEGFLRVLHLLDPLVFPLDDLPGFQRRIASRELVAEVAASLVPENLWGLAPELDRLEAAYSDDRGLCERISALRAVLEEMPNENDPRFLAALTELRTHLLESYRLHRRMLRHRRSAIPWATVGRAGGGIAPLQTGGAVVYALRWDELRHVLNEQENLPDGLCIALLEAALHVRGGASVRELLTAQGLAQPALLAIADSVDFAGQRWRDDGARFETLVETVRGAVSTAGMQVVVFCDRPEDADRCFQALHAALGPAVQRHELPSDSDDEEVAIPAWQAFLTRPETVTVLVCDRRAEEGVNLHGGKKTAIHFDLPAAPNRVEQRLGRLDRYGTGDPVRSIVLVDEGSEAEALWSDLVLEGWQICARSVASLQYLIEADMRQLAREWLHHGSAALSTHLNALDGPNGLVQQELRQIDRYDALDALSEPDEASTEALDECDGDWRGWRSAFRNYAFSVLQFHERVERGCSGTSEDPRFRVGYTHRQEDRPTLMPMTRFLRHFMQSVDFEARGGGSRMPLSHPFVFSRRSATARAAMAGRVRLLRVGDPLVTALERFSEQDDRGRAFALWRADRTYVAQDASGVDLYFRFDFVAEPTVTADEETVDREQAVVQLALARRAKRLLPPCFLRIWLDGNGQVLQEPPALLEASYSDSWNESRRDFNLNPERWRALPPRVRSAWMREWPALCRVQRERAEVAAAQHPNLVERRDEALRSLDREATMAEAQATSRLVRLSGAAREQEKADMARERLLQGLLREALRQPVLRLDVVGAFFVCAQTPEEQ